MNAMIDTPDGPHGISCADAMLLVEKGISEESISAAEQQAVDHHLHGCGACREFVRWTSELPGIADELSAGELDSAVSSILKNRREFRGHVSRRTIQRRVVAAASIAAVTLLGIVVSALLSNEPAALDVSFQCTPARPTEPVSGVMMTYCDDEQPGIIIENGGDVRISLRKGTVGLRIDPSRPNRHSVTVDTAHGQVRVKGTVFAVHVDSDTAWVEVFRGVVEVVAAERNDRAVFVSAGHGAALDTHKTFTLSAPKAEVLLKPLHDAAVDDGVDKGLAGDSTVIEHEDEQVPDPVVTLDSGVSVEGGHQTELSEQVEGDSRRGAGSDSKRVVPSIDALIQGAQSCLLVRDWNCAAARYQEVLQYYSGRPESTAALIGLAKIELRHLNKPKKALAHYRAYQQRAPEGPLAEEALFGIAEVYRRIGSRDKETETLRRFVAKYPKSSLLEKAHARLEELGEVETM